MRWCKVALVIGVAALLASPALAQRRGFGGFARGPDQLLRVEKVQKDLGLDKDQVTKATEALTKVNEDMRDERQKLFSPDTSQEERAEIRKKITEAQNKAIKDVLNEKQLKRLHQIELQQMAESPFGPGPFFQNEEVQKALKLTDDQKDKIKTIQEDLGKEMREIFQPGQKPSEEDMKKMQGLRKEAHANITKVLNDDQKNAMKDLLGAPLELKPEDFPRGGRGGKPGKPRTDF
jgi:hypothetical protein